MRPLRQVVSVAHVLAYRLSCGHTVHRLPLSGKKVIPKRLHCVECEAEMLRAADDHQRWAIRRKTKAEMASHERQASVVRNLLDIR